MANLRGHVKRDANINFIQLKSRAIPHFCAVSTHLCAIPRSRTSLVRTHAYESPLKPNKAPFRVAASPQAAQGGSLPPSPQPSPARGEGVARAGCNTVPSPPPHPLAVVLGCELVQASSPGEGQDEGGKVRKFGDSPACVPRQPSLFLAFCLARFFGALAGFRTGFPLTFLPAFDKAGE